MYIVSDKQMEQLLERYPEDITLKEIITNRHIDALSYAKKNLMEYVHKNKKVPFVKELRKVVGLSLKEAIDIYNTLT